MGMGGHFFDWFMYAIKTVTKILSIIRTRDNNSDSALPYIIVILTIKSIDFLTKIGPIFHMIF